jgi:hypothetical protein
MIRKFIVNRLYDCANILCRVADLPSPTADEIWRSRIWQQWNSQRYLKVTPLMSSLTGMDLHPRTPAPPAPDCEPEIMPMPQNDRVTEDAVRGVALRYSRERRPIRSENA